MGVLIIVGLVVLAAMVIMGYNKIVSSIASVENAEKQIDVQIDVRFKLFENLAKIVSKAMDYEKSTLSEIVKLRTQYNNASSTEEKQEIEHKINSYGGINVIMEAYPDLKANENTLELQRSVETAERKLAFAKQAYNDAITYYNIQKRSVPTNFIVSMFGSLNKNFSMWELPEEEKKSKESASIQF